MSPSHPRAATAVAHFSPPALNVVCCESASRVLSPGARVYRSADAWMNVYRYHDENTKLEDLTHPEDIEHFKKHEQMEIEQERIDKLNEQSIIEQNIPQFFRRQ